MLERIGATKTVSMTKEGEQSSCQGSINVTNPMYKVICNSKCNLIKLLL